MPLDVKANVSKVDAVKAVLAQSETLPALRDLLVEDGSDSPLGAKELVARANEIMDGPQELTTADKAAAFAELVHTNPDAVLVPTAQAYMRYDHRIPGSFYVEDTFIVSLFSERMGSKAVDIVDTLPRKRDPDVPYVAPNRPPTGAVVSKVPKVFYAEVYDDIERGALKMYEDRDAILAENWGAKTQHTPGGIIRGRAGGVSIEPVKGRNGSVTFKMVQMSTKTENVCAFNVLNGKMFDGPLPPKDQVSDNVRRLTREETEFVRLRILDCLSNPTRYSPQSSRVKSFTREQEMDFFTALVEYEQNGMNPPRPNSTDPHGDFRPQIMRIIRDMCDGRGMEVVGTWVRNKQSKGDSLGLTPTMPLKGNTYDVDVDPTKLPFELPTNPNSMPEGKHHPALDLGESKRAKLERRYQR